jgi:hypothetical protein
MKKTAMVLAILGLMIPVVLTTICAADEGLTKGAYFPAVTLTVPDGATHKRYLGLSGTGTFDIPDIKADIVIVEIFSMY